MTTLLYATNCTKTNASALKYAYGLSLAMHAELHVLHVYDLFPILTATVRSRSILEANYSEEQYLVLKQFCKKHLKKDFGTPHLHYHVKNNDHISEAILDKAQKINADLILIGAKNPSAFGIFSGNIANAIMAQAACPLLVLPDELYYHGLSTLLYATDFEEADIHAINRLVEVAEPYGAKIKVIHIPRQMEVDYERKMVWFKEMVMQRITYPEISFSTKRAEDVESGIHDYIKMDLPEMLVMMERQKESFLKRLLHKDMVKTMGDEISIPLMVFNKKSIQTRLSEQFEQANLMPCL